MSLVVWLPLNGNLENQGLSNVTVTNNGATVDNNGKIGKCYSFSGGANCLIVNYGKNIPANNLTISCWAYIVANSNDKIIFGVANGSNQRLYVGIRSDYYQLAYGAQNWGSTPNTAKATIGEWHHIAVSIGNNICSMYYDGKFIHSISQAAFNFASDIMIGGRTDGFTGSVKINDFRIYDHALSAKEVKELAKGLVLHYRLAGPGQTNLLIGTGPNDSEWGINQSGGAYTKTITNDCTTFNVTATGTKWFLYAHGLPASVRSSLKTNTIYTYSFETKSTANFNFNILIKCPDGTNQISNEKRVSIIGDNEWHKYSVQLTTIASFSSISRTDQYFYMNGGNVISTVSFRNAKLEEGPIATPWCPNPKDALYSTMGYNIEYDCSGYCRNGIKSENIIWDIDTPRHITSYKLNGTTVDTTSSTATGAAYVVGPCQMPSTSNITIAWWDKINKYGRGGIFETTSVTSNFQNGTDYNTTAFANWDATFGIYNGTTRINIFNQIKIDSNWHHYAITYNGVNVIVYRDGAEVQKSALTGNLPAFNGIKIGLGRAGGVYRQINKNTSDFRIYATALSAEDIAELYHTAGWVDPGVAAAYEFKED